MVGNTEGVDLAHVSILVLVDLAHEYAEDAVKKVMEEVSILVLVDLAHE